MQFYTRANSPSGPSTRPVYSFIYHNFLKNYVEKDATEPVYAAK